jgi:hypothetical protein
LWRDTYYLSNHSDYAGNNYMETVSHEVFTDPAGWPTDYHLKSYSMYVQPGHYLVLGDNSASSSDSRFWRQEGEDDRLSGGLVPEDQMLGEVTQIYFPPSRAGPVQ